MKNQIIKTKCIDITNDFYGVCKYEGLVIFVKGMLPDEVGDVKIINYKKNLAYGLIEKLDIKSQYRVIEKCPIAYKCGGCDIEHACYKYQLELKKKALINTFSYMKLDININDVIGSENDFNYRNKMMVPVSNDKIGFYRNHSNDIVEFDYCYIETDESNMILKDMKVLLKKYGLFNDVRHIMVRCNALQDEYMLCLVLYKENSEYNGIINEIVKIHPSIKSAYININDKNTNVVLGEKSELVFGKEYIIDKIHDLMFHIPLKSFYQINNSQMVKLYEKIVDIGELNSNDVVLDLFCGIGTISLFVSKYVKNVIGIEIVKESIDYAIINKKINNIDNVDFILGDANIIDEYISTSNTIIIDPPRKGINSKLINSILNSDIKKIIYISCNPATLARDLGLLKEKYSYSSLTPFDMFPNTKHIESIIRLDRK